MPRPPFERSQSNRRRQSNAAVGGTHRRGGRRGSLPSRGSAPTVVEERRGPSVENVLTDVMRAYMSLELELTDEGQVLQLASALRSNTSVTSINLSYNLSIKDAGLRALARSLEFSTTVATINLSGCTGFSDAAGADFLRQLDNLHCLHSVSVSGCKQVGDKFAAALAASLPQDRVEKPDPESGGGVLQLREVNMSGCLELTDSGLTAIGDALILSSALKTLVLQGCVKITDSSIFSLAEGLKHSPALETLDLSWCEELTDDSAYVLGGALSENCHLSSLLLSCCVRFTDEGIRAIASSLESNQTLTKLDLSWCVKVGEQGLVALTQAMIRNHSITTLNLTGCKCMNKGLAPVLVVEQAPRRRGSVVAGVDETRTRALPSLQALLQRNRTVPRAPKTLTASILEKGGGSKEANTMYGKRGLITGPAELLRTLRATILNGAALYNAEDGEACYKLFVQTAESVIASTRSPTVAEALLKVTSIYAPREMQQKLWLLRCAFDSLVDELVEMHGEDTNA